MRTIQSFDPSVGSGGQITTQTVNPCSVVVLFNHSLNGLALDFPDGSTAVLPPWYFRYYHLSIPGNITWSRGFALTSTGPPVSLVTGEVYEPSEAENRTFTEGPLPLAVNVGNTVNTNTSGSNSVDNDGNPPGTVFVKGTESGNGAGSNVFIENSGDAAFKQFVGSVLTTLFQIISNQSGNNPSVKIGATNLLAEVLGDLKVDGTVTLGNGSNFNIIDSNNILNKIIYLDGSNNVTLQTSQTDEFVYVNHNGGLLCAVQSEVNGGFQLGNGISVNGTGNTFVFGPILGVDGSGNTIIQAHPDNNQVKILDKNGAVLSTIDANGCINMTGTVQTVTGDTSGTMTVQEIFAGGMKLLVVKQNNYRQNAATPQQLVLKNTFTGPFLIVNAGCGGMQILNGASVQSGNYFNSMVATGSTFLAETSAQQCTFGWNNTAIDRVQSQGGYASAHTGVFVLIGF